MTEISEVIENLQLRRDLLTDRLRRMRVDRRREDRPLSTDLEDQAVERENDEVLDGLDSLERDELREIEAAIERVEAGRFGVCEGCREEIGVSRLAAAPTARLCSNCMEASER